jgi:DNA-binding transcriptional regulator/RsmH inhibitor MraZ
MCLLDDGVLGSVEVRKADPQGRLVLPAEWRGELGESGEVILVKGPGFIKLIPEEEG